MKTLVSAALTAILLAGSAQAGTKELPACDHERVEAALIRYARFSSYATIVKVMATIDVNSKDPTENRWCRSEVLTSAGSLYQVVYDLRWTSETDGRFWLQVKGSSRM